MSRNPLPDHWNLSMKKQVFMGATKFAEAIQQHDVSSIIL